MVSCHPSLFAPMNMLFEMLSASMRSEAVIAAHAWHSHPHFLVLPTTVLDKMRRALAAAPDRRYLYVQSYSSSCSSLDWTGLLLL